MPAVLRFVPYRFFFYSADGGEPPHVHVQRDDATAKFWLDPVRLETSHGFSRVDLSRIEALVVSNREVFVEEWNGYFRN